MTKKKKWVAWDGMRDLVIYDPTDFDTKMDVNGERGANLESRPYGYEDVVTCEICRP